MENFLTSKIDKKIATKKAEILRLEKEVAQLEIERKYILRKLLDTDRTMNLGIFRDSFGE